MEYKEDAEEAKQRWMAWWDHENADRPVIAYAYPKPNAPPVSYDSWYLAKHHDDIEGAVDLFERHAASTFWGAEEMPVFWPNYGAGIFAAVFGADQVFKSDTVWFFPRQKISLDEIVPMLEAVELNGNNDWYARLLRITEYAAQRAGDNYMIGTTDYGGLMDILASFLEPKDIFYGMKNRPEIIDVCRAIILEKSQKVFDDLVSIVLEHCHGTSAWMKLWCAKRWYPLQCDFSYMLSPKWFRRFVLPDLVELCRHLDYAIYHLDGVNQLSYLDDLLAIPELTGIQWVPGDGKPSTASDVWMPVYRKIQEAGKNIVTDGAPGELMQFINQLDPKGLYIGTNFIGKIFADYFLPPSMGGMGGHDEEEDAP
jgi:5-methyltetrahydrofolate--homocysteine methyltransferase